MYNKYKTILLDIDADFMWDGDNCNHDNHKHLNVEITGKDLGKSLKRFVKPNTKIHLMVDHHESLYWWDQYKVKKALCYHIDAHHDMWKADVEPLHNRSGLDCGNFLQQALKDDVVRKVIYTPPEYKGVMLERAEAYSELSPRMWHRVSVNSWKTFLRRSKRMPKADIITIAISPEWTPKSLFTEVEDLCKELGIDNEMIQDKKQKADKTWQKIREHFPERSYPTFKFPYSAKIYL